MKYAKITKPEGFTCCPDGHTRTTFNKGETVSGKVAEWALQERAASAVFDPREKTKVESPPETKAKRKKKVETK
jgi:hypothetical protein